MNINISRSGDDDLTRQFVFNPRNCRRIFFLLGFFVLFFVAVSCAEKIVVTENGIAIKNDTGREEFTGCQLVWETISYNLFLPLRKVMFLFALWSAKDILWEQLTQIQTLKTAVILPHYTANRGQLKYLQQQCLSVVK